MYNAIFIFFILALQTALSINQQKTSELKFSDKLIEPKLINGCENIQCPREENPVCVKIKLKKHESANKTLYINMLNKCEIEYTKCYEELDAIVVPMKYCKHENVSEAGKRRFKRGIEGLPQTVGKLNKAKRKTAKKVKPKKVQPKAIRQGHKSSDHLTDADNNLETDHELSHNDDDLETQHNLSYDDASFHDGYENETLYENRTAEIHAMIKASEADCPKQCIGRDVMVCAKCQHGVYKTFSSVCHMRMFSCEHPDEVLELMSRSPCVLSAPYLETKHNMANSTIGRMTQQQDQDIILRYIKCRQRATEFVPNMNLRDNGIPQIPLDCNFDKTSKLFGIGIGVKLEVCWWGWFWCR